MIDSRIEKMRPRTARREEREVEREAEDESEDAAEHKARSTSERRGRICGRTRRLPRVGGIISNALGRSGFELKVRRGKIE